ncbi:hypothetical protein [Aquimarina algicola]|uniref:Uncharacterized protein n=1 Tax=Aquimarina algicola TaxID=2589995 RepID=A0A504J7D1_9FLAO|nr:hypothetical protein [Aquimarina algicola]TPN84515.1 hypothetical protein FHK87_16415 [Aquimarina algicola]
MNNFKHFLFIILISLSFFSCHSQKEELRITSKVSELPVKILEIKKFKDSSEVYLMIPQEFSIINSLKSDLRLSRSHLGKFSNIISLKDYHLYSFDGELKDAPYKMKIDKGETKNFRLYAGYRMIISDQKILNQLNKTNLVQTKQNFQVYDIGGIKKNEEFLNQKVPDSLEGSIYLQFYNFSSKQRFFKDTPVEF